MRFFRTAVFFLVSCELFGQRSSSQAFEGYAQKQFLELPERALEITLPDTGSWSLGVMKSADRPSLAVVDTPREANPAPGKTMNPPQAHPTGDLMVGAGRLAIVGDSGARGLVIFGELPAGTVVTVVRTGKILFRGVLAESLWVQDGAVENQPLRNLAQAVMRQLLPDPRR